MSRILFISLLLSAFSAQALTIGAYNIRNFDYDERYKITTDKPALAKIIKGINADVLSVEEINDTRAFELFTTDSLPGYAVKLSECGGAHGQRLGFLYNTKTVELLSFNEDLTITMAGGGDACNSGSRPLAIALFKIKASGQKFYGMTAHLKSGGNSSSASKRDKQYEVIQNTIQELKAKTGVQDFYFAGDLNTTEYLNRGNDYKALNKIVSELGMINLTRDLKCSAYWWGGSDDGIETPSLLDHVVVTPGLLKDKGTKAVVGGHCQLVNCKEVKVKELGVSYAGVSDHCPVTAVIQ
jgi:hypothetical protein